VVAVATSSYIFVFNLDFLFWPKLCCVSVHDRAGTLVSDLARALTKMAGNADALSMGFYF
jgi:hypothetical protein